MTHEEKAKEIVERFESIVYDNLTFTGDGTEVMGLAKQCAVIYVDGKIEECEFFLELIRGNGFTDLSQTRKRISEWNQVKQEIEKL